MRYRRLSAWCLTAVLTGLPSSAFGQAATQAKARQMMMVTDGKNVTTEIVDYAIQFLAANPTRLLEVDRGDAKVTYELDRIAKIELRPKPAGPGCVLDITLLDGTLVQAEKVSGSGGTRIKGRTKDGGSFELFLCSAKTISFK